MTEPRTDVALQAWLERRWYQGARPGWMLGLLECLFALASGLRRHAYRRAWLRSTRLPVPVLVVGNIGVGGTGKTPLVIALCAALREQGWKPGVVSRGYGRQERDARRVEAASTAEQVGDEPRLIAQRTGCPTAVAASRAEAAALLLQDGDVDLIITDDGLQHYSLQRDVEIAVIDGVRGLGNQRLLPAGPLREPPRRLSQCDFVLRNGAGEGAGIPADAVTMQLQLGSAHRLRDGTTTALSTWQGVQVQAVAGIGNPARFFSALRSCGLRPVEHAFADHHHYCAEDFAFDDGQPLLMTEKDAVKCSGWARAHWYAVPVDAALPAAFTDAVSKRLLAAKERLGEC